MGLGALRPTVNREKDQEPNAKSFVVADDRALLETEIQKASFAAIRPHLQSITGLTRPSNWEMFEGTVLALVLSRRSDHEIIGSATMIGPGIALTAYHLFDDRKTANGELLGFVDGSLALMCIGIAGHGAEAWTIMHAVPVPNSDLCILSLQYLAQLPERPAFQFLSMTTRTPRVDEQLFVAGFRADQPLFERDDGRPMKLEAGLLVNAGVIAELFLEGRSDTRPGPQLMVLAETVGGMSGGPVFDADGFLIGILSAGMADVSYLSLIWPALVVKIPLSWPMVTKHIGTVALVDVVGRLCAIDRPDALTRNIGSDTYSYKEWSHPQPAF
jgi:hypothetical protein